ncbi:MAG: hypothetical protein CMO74_05965 [Verrucomicrobiales bacterium]|nr:hypothetical protein [Verrucomicrobiales bacterium]|tara:strand:+ start:632 stop:925 length:294 start_codon:yes stop_codon:yes gene_type:complete
MNIHPNIDPQSPLQPPQESQPADQVAKAPTPAQLMFQSDSVDLAPVAEPAPENVSIQSDADAAAAAVAAAQQIQEGSPDDLYDWSGMTPEKLRELLS